MHIFCDESGGVGRGVMTLAAVAIEQEVADALIARFRAETRYHGEVKGSRINLSERALIIDMFVEAKARAIVGVATRALRPEMGEDRGTLDRDVYALLLDHTVARLFPETGGCAHVVIDDGRYSSHVVAQVRDEIATMIGPAGDAELLESHRSSGIQIADVIANSFYNRALPGDRQSVIGAMLAPLLGTGRIRLEVLRD